MGTMWVLTANRGFAKLFEVKGVGRQIKEIHHIDNPEGRKKGSEIFTDSPGRSFDRLGPGRHALTNERDAHEREQKTFTHKIADLLQQGLENHDYNELALIAPDKFLGELHQVLSEHVKKATIKEVHKDLAEHLSNEERLSHICKYLDLWNRVSTAPSK
jgi:protein required for attachment to host cells